MLMKYLFSVICDYFYLRCAASTWISDHNAAFLYLPQFRHKALIVVFVH